MEKAQKPHKNFQQELKNLCLERLTYNVKEEIVYQATKTVLENLDHMGTVHPAWKRVSTDSILGGFNAPLHPGALRYYREANVPGIEEFVARTSN